MQFKWKAALSGVAIWGVLTLAAGPAWAAGVSVPALPETVSGMVETVSGQPVTEGTIYAYVGGSLVGSLSFDASTGAFGGTGLQAQLVLQDAQSAAGEPVVFMVTPEGSSSPVQATASPEVSFQPGASLTGEMLTIPNPSTGSGSSPSLTIRASLPGGQVGEAYAASLAAQGGTAPYTFQLAAGSTLPAGLSLSSGGAISGTPTAAGDSYFTVDVTDSSNPAASAETTLSLLVAPAGVPLAAVVSGSSSGSQPVTVSIPQVAQVTAANGSGAVTLGEYQKDPAPTPPSNATGAYYDVNVSPGSSFQTMTAQFCQLNGGTQIEWWTGSAWELVSPQSYQQGCAVATFSDTSSPPLSALSGTLFAAAGSGSSSTTPPGSPGSSSPPSSGSQVTRVTAALGAGAAQTLSVTSSQNVAVSVAVPAGSLQVATDVTLSAPTGLPSGVTAPGGITQVVAIQAKTQATGAAVTYLDEPFHVSLTFPSAAESVRVLYWNPLLEAWQPVARVRVDAADVAFSAPTLGLFAVVPVQDGVGVDRLAGTTRIGTAIQAAEAAYPNGADAVVLANAGTGLPSPDALSAAGLAGALHIPTLLTAANQLSAGVLSAIDQLDAKTIYVVGGTSAVSDADVKTLTAHGLTVVRDFAGQNRFATALLVDQYLVQHQLLGSHVAFIANGITMVDALSASPVLYREAAPLILVNSGQAALTAADLALLKSAGITSVYILGGKDAVMPTIATQVANALSGATTLRLAGATRVGTAAAIDRRFFNGPEGAIVSADGADGSSFVDALSAAALAGVENLPIVLTDPGSLPADTTAYLGGLNLHAVWVMGGTAAVSDTVASQLNVSVQ